MYVASISLAPGTSLHQFAVSRLALSPDGRHLAIATGQGVSLRSLDHGSSQPLAGTEGAGTPFWSPDGSQIGFFARNELKRVNRSGGPPITLARADGFNGASWNRDGVIVFGSYGSALRRVSDSGGTPVPVTTLNKESGEHRHTHPFFLPDGNHFVYTALGTKTGGPFDANGVHAGSLSSPQTKLVVAGGAHGKYANGYLFYIRQHALLAQRFDVGRTEVIGEAVVVAPEIETDLVRSGHPTGAFSVSQMGELVYQVRESTELSQLRWFDRSGKHLGTLGETASYSNPEISPSGERAAVAVRDPARQTVDIWIFDLVRGGRTRLTSGAMQSRSRPIWSPDGNRNRVPRFPWRAHRFVSEGHKPTRRGGNAVVRRPEQVSGQLVPRR